MIGYKLIDKNNKSLYKKFNYEISKTYKHKGPLILGLSGFHFCVNPLQCILHVNGSDNVDHDSRLIQIRANGRIKGNEKYNLVTDNLTVLKKFNKNDTQKLLTGMTIDKIDGNHWFIDGRYNRENNMPVYIKYSCNIHKMW